MSALDAVLDDLVAESAQVDGWVAVLTPDRWQVVTTPEGWTVAHQVAHLHWTDLASTYAIADRAAFDALILEAMENPEGYVDAAADELALQPLGTLLSAWREGRGALVEALRSVPDGEKVPWFGPPMSPVSMATARLMETWAHGHDVAEGLGIEVPRTDRAKHVCHIGVRTFAFAHVMRGEEAPDVPVRVELTAPSGDLWTWGPRMPRSGSPGMAGTSPCWPPAAATAPTSTSPLSVSTPITGSTSFRRSPDCRATTRCRWPTADPRPTSIRREAGPGRRRGRRSVRP